MKPQRFKPGQEVVCTKKGVWRHSNGRISFHPAPDFNSVCVVTKYKVYNNKMQQWTICLDGFGELGHGEANFEPLVSDEVLEKALSEVNELELI